MRARLRQEGGFGMVELLVAIMLLSVGLLAIVAAFGSGSVAIHRASRVATASSLADAQIERYRALRYGSIALDTGSVSSANANSTYTGDSAWSSTQVTASCPSLPPECTASQSVVGADGRTYRVDTYIVPYTPTSGRQGRRITVVVRDPRFTPPQTLARLPSTFDQATG